MLKKKRFIPSDLLILLILFHLVGNIIWIKLNNAPPPWDQAYHTKVSFEFANLFEETFSGKFSLNLLKPFSDFYGPLIRLITGLILFIFVPSIKLAQFIGTLFFLLTIILIYFFAKKISDSEWIGLIASFIFSFHPIIFDNSRWLLIDIPMVFFILLSIYFLIKSDFLFNKKYSLLTFLFFSLVILTKLQGFIYLIYLFFYILYSRVNNYRKGQVYKFSTRYFFSNILIGFFLMLISISSWLIFSFKNIINYFFIAVRAEPFSDPVDLLKLSTWFHYLKLFINYEISFFVFLFFILFLFFFIKSKNKYRFFILGYIIFYYLLFTMFPNKDMRYLFPILPFTSLIFAIGFFEFQKVNKVWANIGITLVLLFNITTYLTLSFGFPIKKGFRGQINLPFIKDLVYINLTDYPAEKFDSNEWPNEKLINDLSNLSIIKHGKKKVLLALDHQKINNSNLSLFIYKNKINNIELIYPYEVVEFKEHEVINFIEQFDYVLLTRKDVNPFYLFNKKALDQIRNYVLKQNYQQVLSYNLPIGETLEILEIKK